MAFYVAVLKFVVDAFSFCVLSRSVYNYQIYYHGEIHTKVRQKRNLSLKIISIPEVRSASQSSSRLRGKWWSWNRRTYGYLPGPGRWSWSGRGLTMPEGCLMIPLRRCVKSWRPGWCPCCCPHPIPPMKWATIEIGEYWGYSYCYVMQSITVQ